MQLHASIVDHFGALTFRVSRIMLSKESTACFCSFMFTIGRNLLNCMPALLITLVLSHLEFHVGQKIDKLRKKELCLFIIIDLAFIRIC